MKKPLVLALALYPLAGALAQEAQLNARGFHYPKAVEQNAFQLVSHYKDYDPSKVIKKNAVNDFKLTSSPTLDQSASLQAAIDGMAALGGGELTIPKGTYCFGGVLMKSNVHILVEAGTVFHPVYPPANKKRAKQPKVCMLNFSTPDQKHSGDYIENCSMRGKGGTYTVDYSNSVSAVTGVRFASFGMVKNFLMADAVILDNYSVYCGFIMTPSGMADIKGLSVTRPTQGELRHCSIYKGNAGYGLVQLHGADDIYFEDIYAKGGVTLRLESGAASPNIGVYDIRARKVASEEGRNAVMMNPHCGQNGRVQVDGILSIGSSHAATVGGGYIDKKNRPEEDRKPGKFADDCRLSNIHAIYGTDAQVARKSVWMYEPSQETYDKLRIINYGYDKFLNGPSIDPVRYTAQDCYTASITNVTQEGFPQGTPLISTSTDTAAREKQKWDIPGSIPQINKEGNYKPKTKKAKKPKKNK